MPDRKFDLGDYVEVKDRIAIFYELYPQGRLVTGKVYTEMGPDGTPRVVVKAKAYRTPDDPLPGKGTSWMALPGTTSYTRGSEVENTETSAWGRAIASLGILVDKSIASAQEVQNKQDDGAKPRGSGFVSDTPFKEPEGGLIGTAEVGKARDSDFELRETPDGWALGFKLKSNGGGFKVLTRDELALQLLDAKDEVVGKRVTVYGRVRDEKYTPKGSSKTVVYQVVDAERIKTEAGTLPVIPWKPVPFEDSVEPVPVAEGQEALFDPAESARLDAEEAAKP
jgi:hypothetical protein